VEDVTGVSLRAIDDLGELVGEPAAPADGGQLLVRVELEVAGEQLQLVGGQAEVGEDREVALGPGVVQRVVVGRQLDAEQVEDVGGDVVVERGDRVGEQQRDPPGHGPQQHEELVVDVEQPEHGPGGPQPAQLGDGGVEVLEGLRRQAGAAPPALLPDRRHGEPGQGRHPRGRLDALHSHATTVGAFPAVGHTTSGG
jgi:hypothetical protein